MELKEQNVSAVRSDYINVTEAMRYTGFSRSWFYQAMDDGDLECLSLVRRGKNHGKRLIKRSSLEAFLAGQGGKTNGTNA